MNRASVALLLLGLAAVFPALAGPFEVAVTPSRFVLDAKSGTRVGRVIDIYNVGNAPTEVSVRTIDWSYSEQGHIGFHDALQPGSCRPWVTLERKTVKIAPRSKVGFRFQVDVPPDAPRSECRLMLAVEGLEPAQQTAISQGSTSLQLPVSGRIAVAVYLALNGAEPKLSIGQIAMKEVQGRRTPVITVRNEGDAHGRLEGSLDAVDAKGLNFELVPEGTPVLPGQTRILPLSPRSDAASAQKVPTFPVKVTGALDWDKGAFKIDAELK
ncbi:COG1470 family protein [Variovorax boronicumulans]|uniref:COG1470 family protein n=1 Tax=Variovorax boronicumulans TaxID=436515 RepID=UPI0013304240|nr:hypothetical protein [Variovorax boronicumulans]